MALHFCKTCGTVFDDKNGGCPKCATSVVMDAVTANTYAPPESEMSEAESSAARKKSWIQLVIGVPCFIGFIYLLVYIFKIIKGG
ncbi:MAG: hypothetical protein PHC80_02060 [Eubacteriales bacterium]|nr:hypothetical protein [Eubacteriales bacterium]